MIPLVPLIIAALAFASSIAYALVLQARASKCERCRAGKP